MNSFDIDGTPFDGNNSPAPELARIIQSFCHLVFDVGPTKPAHLGSGPKS